MSTHPLMLPSLSPKEALFACLPAPSWKLLAFTVKSTLSSSCSHSNSHLSRQNAALAHLNSLSLYDLVFSTEGFVLFPFGKGGSGVLAKCSLSVALTPLFPFRQAQCAQVFPLKPAPFCTLFAGLGSTNKSATALLFSSDLILALFSLPYSLLHFSFYLNLSCRNCLLSPPVLSCYNGPPTLVSPGERRG